MKWLLLVLVVLVLLGVVWWLAARRSTVAASRPHRLDDCLSTRDTDEAPAPDDPTVDGPQGSDVGATGRT